jgi:mono/diheme cytochrome c family protein
VTRRPTRTIATSRYLKSFLPIFFFAACTAPGSASYSSGNDMSSQQEQIARGRQLVLDHGCADCHSMGVPSPVAVGFLAGMSTPDQEFQIGPFKTRPRNLTPDNATGLGRFSERQIFNAIRYGLRPGETPDVEITSTIPGQGNFPQIPKYLAPPMPWVAFRHMKDDQIWAIAAYLKNGLKPVSNRVKDSDGPPDFWASAYTVEKFGPYPAPPFPAAASEKGGR